MTQTKTNKSGIQKILIPVTALIILLLMVAWLAGSFNDKVAPALNEFASNKSSAATIDQSNSYTIKATKETIFEPVSASLKAKQATIISSRTLARIEQINTRAGQLVKKGDLLIQLEKNDLQAQVLQAQQNVNAMQAQDKEAKQNLDRAVELFKTKLISTFELDKNSANYQTIKAELIAAKQALSQAQTTLSYATLIAPINGRIIDRFAEPGDTAQPGVKLLTLYNPFSLRVEAQVREQLALTLTNGQEIEVELPSVNKKILGEVEEIVPAANTGSRSFLIKVRISYHKDLLPGMYARMLIPAGKKTKLTIPKNKVSHVGQLDLVWVIVDGEIQRRLVRLGKENDNNMLTVLSGLIPGDKVIKP
jgi:RND family efflux transporter MFP subunit